MRRTLTFVVLILIVVVPVRADSVRPENVESPEAKAARLSWWREARFGLFIHCGPVSLKGTEISWSRANSNPNCPNKGRIPVEVYDNLYKEFNPTRFDASEWIQVAENAGMKYVVLTAKHCDGFLLWHSKASTYNMSATPFKRDICAELAKAAHERQMRIGWYFSPMDWRDPDFRTDRNSVFIAKMQAEIGELLSGYGPIDLMWFDYDGREPVYDRASTYDLVKKLQPRIIINNRLDLGKGHGNREMLSPYADYYTPEQQLGSYDHQRPWETCMTLGRQWSWKPDDRIKSVPEVIQILLKCVGGDGNLLLDVGPMPDGRIEPRQVEVLAGVGRWLKANGESIYATRGGPFKPGKGQVSTRKGNVIYVHVMKWEGESLTLPAIGRKIVSSALLGGGKVDVKEDDRQITIVVPTASQDAIDTIVRLELDGPAADIASLSTAAEPAVKSAK